MLLPSWFFFICLKGVGEWWPSFLDSGLSLVRLYSSAQKQFACRIPRLTHFPGFSFNCRQLKRLTERAEGEKWDRKKYTAIQSVMVSESMILFTCKKEPMENYLTRPSTTKSPLNLIFISWVRCGDAEEAEREFKTCLPRLNLQLYPLTVFQCGVFLSSKHL